MRLRPFGSGRFPSPRGRAGGRLRELAEAADVTPPQLALAFLAREDHVFAIPKASVPAHAVANAAAGDLTPDPSVLRSVGRAFPRGPRRASLPFV